MRDIARQKPKSIFDNDYKKMLKRAHDDNGLTVQLNLSEMPDTYKDEFKENSHWLKFGFHALNSRSNYSAYDAEKFVLEAEKVYDNLYRIVSFDATVYDVRLGFALGSLGCIKHFKNKYPLFKTLYGVDDNRIEYYLSQEENNTLLEYGTFYDKKAEINIKLSELRLENQTDMAEYMKTMPKHEYYAFFTHEQFLSDEKIRRKIVELCQIAKEFTF